MQEENAHNSAPGTKKPPCLGRLFYPKLAEWRHLATSRLGGYGSPLARAPEKGWMGAEAGRGGRWP